MKMKRTLQGYRARSCLEQVLNRLREIKGFISFLYPYEDLVLKNF